MFRTKEAHFRMEVGEPKLVFREEILRSNAASYVAKKLVDIPYYLSKLFLAPLSVAVAAEIPPADTIRVLLQHGEDTNKVSRISGNVFMTPWVHLCFLASPWSFTVLGEEVLSDSLHRRFHGLFLSYGADPSSTMSGCNFTVLAMYLMTVFCVPGYIRQSDEYPCTLNSFLTARANLGAKMYLNSSDLRLSSLAWAKMDGMRQTNGGRFMSEVVRTILVHEKTPRHYVSSLGDILPQVFSEHIARPLLRMIGNTSDNYQGPSGKDKERQYETRDILDCDKRRKTES
ncbi:uncharacterized protein FFB14_15322 [Fusarium fujikuroi]|nr:uncharacterized protein FFB14_15322 [Fusarium fujikuroi]